MFLLAREIKKKEAIENYITLFNTLKSGFICQRKKTFEDWVSEIQFKTEYFCRLPELKNYLE